MRRLRRLLWTLPVVLLAACSGIDKGDKLEYMTIVNASTGVALQPPLEAYQCLRQQLTVFGTFTSGALGNYTTRVTWVSSNPGVVKVSNADPYLDRDPANPNNVIVKGVITPVSVGTATVYAQYIGFNVGINVEVKAPDQIVLSTAVPGPGQVVGSTPAPANTGMAPTSVLQFHAIARLNGVDADISSDATWTIANDPNHAIATITPSGLVTAVAPGGPATVNANFAACAGTAFENRTANVTVSPISSLALSRQFAPGTELVAGTTEAMQTIATLASGDTQDLSTQATYTTSTAAGSPAILAFVANVATATTNIGTTDVTASFKNGDNVIESPPITIATQNATLNGISIPTADQNKQIAQLDHTYITAVGTFTPTLGGANFTQDISRSVLWTVSDTTALLVSNLLESAGYVQALQNYNGCYTVTAQIPGDASKIASTKLGVGIPVSPYNCP